MQGIRVFRSLTCSNRKLCKHAQIQGIWKFGNFKIQQSMHVNCHWSWMGYLTSILNGIFGPCVKIVCKIPLAAIPLWYICACVVQLHVPAVPVFLCVNGLYDVEYQVSVATRDACIYTIKGGGHSPKYKVALGSQPCGMQRVDKDLVVGCMDQTLCCYTVKVTSKFLTFQQKSEKTQLKSAL